VTLNQSEAELSGRDAAVTALASLSLLTESSVSGVMLIAQHNGSPPDISQLIPTERALPVLNDVVHKAAADFMGCEVIDYGPATTTADGQIMWIAVESVPFLKAIVTETTDLAGMPMFDPARAKLADLQLAAMHAVSNSASATFIQSLRGNQIVAQSSRIGVIIRRGTVDLPRRGQILLFSREVAVVVIGENAYFEDRAGFQRLFGYLDELRRRADATFRSITRNLQIDGFEEMAATVTGSTNMLGKMASIERKIQKYPQYREAMTMPKLVDFINDHPECEVEVTGEGDAAQLVFRKDVQHRFKILKLLDDDYLRSELTELDYEANSKGAPIGDV